MDERFQYDAVVKDLFEKDHPSLLDKLTGARKVRTLISAELPVILKRVADLLFRLDKDTVLHLDFQSTNDRDMVYRAGIYALLIAQKYRCRQVEQVVVYMGADKMRMAEHLDLGGLKVKYALVDIRELQVDDLLASGRPGDYALAVLANGGVERMREIIEHANRLPGEQRQRVLTQMVILSGLRGASKRLRMELKNMGMSLEIRENVFLKEIYESGLAKGKTTILREQIESKFGPLPKWADARLETAKPSEVNRWARKVLTAGTLEGVIGKK